MIKNNFKKKTNTTNIPIGNCNHIFRTCIIIFNCKQGFRKIRKRLTIVYIFLYRKTCTEISDNTDAYLLDKIYFNHLIINNIILSFITAVISLMIKDRLGTF